MNARAASEPGVVALMATDICTRISGSTNLTTLVVPTTGKACNQQCGTIVAHAPAPTTAYSEGTESVSTCGRNATPLSPNALDPGGSSCPASATQAAVVLRQPISWLSRSIAAGYSPQRRRSVPHRTARRASPHRPRRRTERSPRRARTRAGVYGVRWSTMRAATQSTLRPRVRSVVLSRPRQSTHAVETAPASPSFATRRHV
jgi:hypothetical protein